VGKLSIVKAVARSSEHFPFGVSGVNAENNRWRGIGPLIRIVIGEGFPQNRFSPM
jgi:hypothetical protein